jgi:phospholipid/cholesterol/gamma-HCH transport system substrate-binding protein
VRATAPIARIVAIAALIAAVVVAGFVLLGGTAEYTVKARFQNAAQLVKGNLVQVSGLKAGEIQDIALTPDGQAEITMTIDEAYAPLRVGTHATVRQASLSGVANRYVDLRLAPDDAERIADGGVIGQDSTTTAVELDQIFNTFDDDTRKSLARLLRESATQHEGRGEQMNAGLAYLNPSLAASSRLFRELNRDTRLFERFVVASSQLVTDVADRREDLAGLVDNLATTTDAIGDEQAALAESIERLPAFQRRANTTFLNLRAALDDLDPLVDESKPVVRKLRPFMNELRPLAQDARPTLRDLSQIVRSDGRDDDLIDLMRLQPGLRDATVKEVEENGSKREGAFPASAKAMEGSIPTLANLRPYMTDLVGWFDDFSHSGVYDALGAASRVGIHASAFALLNGQLSPVPPELRDEAFSAGSTINQRNRCPGAADQEAEDGSNPWRPSPEFNCDPSQVLSGR